MSGIYIKGMKMPSKCGICPCLGTDDPDIRYYCCLDYEIEGVSFNSKPKDCPLVPVPDHGRLIDADVLIFDRCIDTYMALSAVANAPTIIPSDKENNNG